MSWGGGRGGPSARNWPAFRSAFSNTVSLLDYVIVISLTNRIMMRLAGERKLGQPFTSYRVLEAHYARQLDFLPAPDTTRMRLLLWLSWVEGSC